MIYEIYYLTIHIYMYRQNMTINNIRNKIVQQLDTKKRRKNDVLSKRPSQFSANHGEDCNKFCLSAMRDARKLTSSPMSFKLMHFGHDKVGY